MKFLLAALQKDLKLFFSGTGIFALLLPILLFFAMQGSSENLAQEAYVAPFPIAVRDLDHTIMSRSLTNQMREVDIFSQVIKVQEGDSDQQFVQQGVAAVITIPADFFYTMYFMDNDKVSVVLNTDMPLQGQLLRSVLTSVVDIISANQSTGLVVYHTLYGALTQEQERQLWDETSAFLIKDALSRQQIFDAPVVKSDTQKAVMQNLLACTISVLCLFFPLSAVKTVPEELHAGILPRFLAAGGSVSSFFISKLITAMLLSAPSLLFLMYSLQIKAWQLFFLGTGILFCCGFSLMLFIASIVKDSAATQRIGNLLLLLSLVLGGSLYPKELLPSVAQLLSPLTLPYYAGIVAQQVYIVPQTADVFGKLLPVIVFLCLFPVSIMLLRHTDRFSGKQLPVTGPAAISLQPEIARKKLSPFFAISGLKLKSMSGGLTGLLSMVAVCFLCGFAAASALNKTPDSLTIGVYVPDSSLQAQQLVSLLEERQGLQLVHCASEEDGQLLLSKGDAEGLFTIDVGYGKALEAGGKLPISYKSAASAASAQAVREMIAGQVQTQRVQYRGVATIEERGGKTLSSSEKADILAQMRETVGNLPALYRFSDASGRAVSPNPYAPSALGFALLAVMLTVFTWSAWTGRSDARQVETRLAAQRHGRLLSYCNDAAVLFLVALFSGAAALFPSVPSLKAVLALLAFSVCITGCALFIVRFSALSGRIDILAPFLALITSLLGGSFGDLTQFSAALQKVSYFTPQGLALWAGRGTLLPFAILLALGIVFLMLGKPAQKKKL